MTYKASYTTDTLFQGKLEVLQPENGYRYSIDTIILANHINKAVSYRDKIIDLGTGSGIIPLILAFKNKEIRILGIELQKSLADLAESNVSANKMTDRIKIMEADFCFLKKDPFFIPCDIVVSNPPYGKVGSGRINPDYQKAVARHEIKASLGQIIKAAETMLKAGGKFIIIYPASRTSELFYEMKTSGIEPKILRTIHPKNHESAKLILAEGVKAGKAGIKILPPLIIYDQKGSYTKEIQNIFA